MPGTNGYVEFRLEDEQPIEPYFNGTVFVNLADKYGTEPMRLKLARSAEGYYAQSVVIADLKYDRDAESLWMSQAASFDMIRKNGAHRNFPFDSASFAFDLKITPPVDLRVIRLQNRVAGFVMDCGSLKATRSDAGVFHIEFGLSRNPLVQLTAVVLCFAAVVFLVLIAFMKSESLPTSVASFFFSLWSVRAILSSQIKTFPTLLDGFILTLCATLLLVLGWKLVLATGNKADRVDRVSQKHR